MGISIDPEEVGVTGLLWLLFSYGYVLYYASNLISEGSELLLLIPKWAGLVGGVVLPLLGAVPDGAIILFSGLDPDRAVAQETLSVGVGALAGSTIMLLTIPWAGSIYAGRVDMTGTTTSMPNYRKKPKLSTSPPPTLRTTLFHTGVMLTTPIRTGGRIMMATTLPYLLIQGPAWYYATQNIAGGIAGEQHGWALGGFIACIIGMMSYLVLQLQMSQQEEDQDKRLAIVKKQLRKGAISLSGAVAAQLRQKEAEDQEAKSDLAVRAASEYQAVGDVDDDKKSSATGKPPFYPSPAVAEYLRDLLAESFHIYDTDKNGTLDRNEVYVFFRDFHEAITEREMSKLFELIDTDHSGTVNLDEFIGVAYMLIKTQDEKANASAVEAAYATVAADASAEMRQSLAGAVFSPEDVTQIEEEENGGEENAEEEETMQPEFTSLTPAQQQARIQRKSFSMLAAGTVLVVLFSDPMVDVLSAVATRVNVSPFYVSFVLAPLASNASEILASQYYASKKTRKTITVALSALEGAAAMNNTFCLSIFMGLVYFRRLAWEYSAETCVILLTQWVVGLAVQGHKMTTGTGMWILCLFPLSIAVVAILESMGFD